MNRDDSPEIMVAIDLGTTYTGEHKSASWHRTSITKIKFRCGMDDSTDTNTGHQRLARKR